MNYPKQRYTGPKPWMDYNWLYTEYVTKDRSTQEIADEYHCQRNTIQHWLIKHNIKKISRKPYCQYEFLKYHYCDLHESRRILSERYGVSERTITGYLRKYQLSIWDIKPRCRKNKISLKDEPKIIDLYVNEKKSSVEIAKLYGVTHRTVLNYLIKIGVERRSLDKAQFASNQKTFISALADADLLYELHWNQHLSCKDLGKQLGCDPGTVRRHMHKLGIPTRNSSESKIGLMVGSKHPNWKGGVTPLHLQLRTFFHTNLAPHAAERDDYTCQECGKRHTMLHVHHIRPFAVILQEIYKEHPDLSPFCDKDREVLYDIATHDNRFLDLDNLQTLCVDCHRNKHLKTISSQADEESEGSETILL